MGKQRVALKDVAEAALLRGQVDPCARVEEHAVTHHDATGIGREEAREALERQRLAGSRRPKERGDTVARRPCHVERETRHVLDEPDVELLAHSVRAPRRAEATTTTHEISVSTATSASASPASPVWTAV